MRRHVVADTGREVWVRATELDVTVSRVAEGVQALDFLPVIVAVCQQGAFERCSTAALALYFGAEISRAEGAMNGDWFNWRLRAGVP